MSRRKPVPPPKTNDRAHGQGSIREIRPGVYRAWRPPAAEGKRQSKRFTSHAAAHRWLVGEPEPEILYTGLYLERWQALKAPTLRGRTPQTYAQFLSYAEETDAPISIIPLADLTDDDCQAWLNGLLATHTRYSVKVTRNVISSALNAAVRRGLIPTNPLRWTKLPSPEEREAKAWTRQQLARILQAARGTNHAVWFSFAIATGLRLGELRALTWDDLDLDAMTVRVNKSLDNNTHAVGPTKTGRARTVDIPAELIGEIRAHRLRQPPGARYVFGNAHGAPHHPTTYRLWLHSTCMAAGVHDADERTLSVHSTRHTFASLALSDPECFLPDVSAALGHATMATTLGIYGHFIDHQARRTAKALGRALLAARGDLHRDLHRSDAATR